MSSSSKERSEEGSTGEGDKEKKRSSEGEKKKSRKSNRKDKYKRSTAKKNEVVLKVGIVGDSDIGKTSLMVRFVEGTFDEDYIQTLGVNFMEKDVTLRNNLIKFSLWDLGGQREFISMLEMVCNDAVVILFVFDLTRKATLISIKTWYRDARKYNKTAIPFLIGTKFDLFASDLSKEEQEDITKQARKFAKAMKAPLIFCSSRHGPINVPSIFRIVLAKAFDLKCNLPQIHEVGEPIFEY